MHGVLLLESLSSSHAYPVLVVCSRGLKMGSALIN